MSLLRILARVCGPKPRGVWTKGWIYLAGEWRPALWGPLGGLTIWFSPLPPGWPPRAEGIAAPQHPDRVICVTEPVA
jgi:hypothetical protein